MRKKIAVTGASGFVGRHLLRALAACEGVDVTASSRSDGAASDWLPAGMRHVPYDPAGGGTGAFEALGRPDVLVHLAWSGLPDYGSLHHFEDELARQFRFLRGLVEAGLPCLLCTGTCFEYGLQSGALAESMPTDPRNPYGFAKDALRRELQFLQTRHPFDLTWARLFYMHGQGQGASSLWGQFSAAVQRGDAVFPMSGGEQLRDYLSAGQVAELLTSLAVRRGGAGIVNVCSGKPTSVRALVERWKAAWPSDIALGLGSYPYPPWEPMAFWGCDDKLRGLLAEPG